MVPDIVRERDITGGSWTRRDVDGRCKHFINVDENKVKNYSDAFIIAYRDRAMNDTCRGETVTWHERVVEVFQHVKSQQNKSRMKLPAV